ncbi:unnamed protein product [Trichobilharzia szidati]|nr:unnamed protein product [Trichobilharzia szidati]
MSQCLRGFHHPLESKVRACISCCMDKKPTMRLQSATDECQRLVNLKNNTKRLKVFNSSAADPINLDESNYNPSQTSILETVKKPPNSYQFSAG